MGGRGHRRRRGTAGALVLVTFALYGCSGPPDDARAAVDALLDARATALLEGDKAGYLSAVDPRARGYRTSERRAFRNLDRIPVADWSYDVGRLRLNGRHAEADVEVRFRLRGYDRAPVTALERLEFIRRDGNWYLSGERPDSPRQVWEQGRVTVVAGSRSLVLGTGVDGRTLRGIGAAADRAVPQVSEGWPRSWPGRLVVLVPGSVEGMGELLTAPASSYEGIAALTTSRAGDEQDAGQGRVVVNPQAYRLLSDEGRQIVMTHETTHVATRAHTAPATPMWLSEGLADWFGYRDAERSPRQAAPELARSLRAGEQPADLPEDGDFRFRGDADTLGRAYESSWLACRMIAERWGEDRLTALYLEVGAHDERGADTVDHALRDVLGVGEEEFTAQWRAYVRTQLSVPPAG